MSCGLNTLKLDEEKKETKEHGEDKNIFLQTLRLLLDINEQHTINQIDAHLSNANNNSASNTKQEDERQPMLDLMLAFHLEGLSAAADESYAMTHKFIIYLLL